MSVTIQIRYPSKPGRPIAQDYFDGSIGRPVRIVDDTGDDLAFGAICGAQVETDGTYATLLIRIPAAERAEVHPTP